jgi:single-strand DNA-binding protein
MTFHQLMAIGNLGKDPEFKVTAQGRDLCWFTIAVNEQWRDGQTQEIREITTWYQVSVFGNQAKACHQYLKKGRQVQVIGTPYARGYMDNTGQAAAALSIKAQRVNFLGGGSGRPEPGDADYYGGSEESVADIPF